MNNEFLRHTLATIAYRFQQSSKDVDPGFWQFDAGKGIRQPGEILHHMNEVLHSTKGVLQQQKDLPKLSVQKDPNVSVERLHHLLGEIDSILSNESLNSNYSKRLLQGPFADVLTHIGQIAMLRRKFGDPIPGEDFSIAPIRTGNISEA